MKNKYRNEKVKKVKRKKYRNEKGKRKKEKI